MSSDDSKKLLQASIDVSLYNRFKSECAKLGMSMTSVVEQLIRLWVSKREEKK